MGRKINKKTKFTIGRLADASGVGISTVRYYQKRGLLRQPDKPALGAVRSYDEQDLQRLLLIKETQGLGFTLAEIADLFFHIDRNDCPAIKSLANSKLRAINDQIRHLQEIRRTLKSLLSLCPQCDGGPCALVASLEKRAGKNRGDD